MTIQNNGVDYRLINNLTKKLGSDYNGVTLSNATLNGNDLANSFMRFLNAVKTECQVQTQVEAIEAEINELLVEDIDILSYILNEDIFDLLNEIAPVDHVFGSHAGNGACFGFWSIYENLSPKAHEAIERGAKIINKDDLVEDFWGHTYHVILDRFISVIVNAEHAQAAVDYAIDWTEENMPHLLLNANDIQEIVSDHSQDCLDMDYTCGGNHCRYIAEMGATVFDITD